MPSRDEGLRTAHRVQPFGASAAVPGGQVINKPFVASDTTLGRALRRAVERRHADAVANPQREAPDLVELLLEELRT